MDLVSSCFGITAVRCLAATLRRPMRFQQLPSRAMLQHVDECLQPGMSFLVCTSSCVFCPALAVACFKASCSAVLLLVI
jgi:hypothetical protein